MANAKQQETTAPTNLILYGPPGTGKTFRTAEEALRLCGESVPRKRDKLMAAYRRLVAAGRIEFVTFHQSMAYEEFVEGRQPTTRADDGENTSTAGFRLETVPGIFRRIAKRAEMSLGHSPAKDRVQVEGRQVFKMSIGEANSPKDAPLFEEPIEGEYTLLGFDNSAEVVEQLQAPVLSQIDPDVRDGIRCRDHLLSQAVDPERNGTRRSVAEWIELASQPSGLERGADYDIAVRMLGLLGLRVVYKNGHNYLAVANQHSGLNGIFAGTHWAGKSGATSVWVQALRRLKDAKPSAQAIRFGAYTSRATLIPLSEILTKEPDGDHSASLPVRSGMLDTFCNHVHEGDIVILSKGDSLFRAIGVFAGGYEFIPRPEGLYHHRRAVQWLWVDREGVEVRKIYSESFDTQSIYLLEKTRLNVPALEGYMNSPQTKVPAGPQSFVLIIDEINRANISKVFGELITLLEPGKRLGQPNQIKVRLPYSGEKFGVPSNLHIIGTMNTADRSIALLDTALRRRFAFRELMPEPSVLAGAAKRTGIDLPGLLSILNERIEYLCDRDHRLGHAYFIGCDTPADVDDVMRYKVIPLLAEYFFEDWAKIAAVLGDLEPHDGKIAGGFLNRSVLDSPPGLDNGAAPPRFRWDVRDEGFDYARLLKQS